MKHKNFLLICIGIIVVIAIIIRVVYINNKFPSPQNNVYTMDQGLNYQGCIIKASGYQVGSPELVKNLLDDYDYEHMFGEKSPMANVGKKVVLVTVDVKNNSVDSFRPTSLLIVSGTVCNGADVTLVSALNPNGYTVKGNSEAKIILAYTITENNVPAKKWSNFENEEFALSCGDRTVHNLLMLKK